MWGIFTGQPLDQRFRSVAQVFKRPGHTTGAVVSAFVLDRSWGLARGFDFYDDAFSPEVFEQKDIGLVDRKAGPSVTRALRWLKDGMQKTPRRPFFFWLHLYDPHSPYDPPEPFRTRYRGHLYDGEIAYASHELGRLMAWLKQSRLYDRSLIVVLSDHGESLGDHGEKEHGFFIYNSTVHIPLIVKPPAGSGFRPGCVTRPVETIAVAPTLLSLAGMKVATEKRFPAQALLGVEAGNEDSAYSESFYSFSSFGWSPLHALQTTRYHYIEAQVRILRCAGRSPGEKQSGSAADRRVRGTQRQVAIASRQNSFKPAEGISAGLSSDALEKLSALGYVAYRSPVSPEALAAGLPDPKSKLWEFNATLEAGDAFNAGNFSAGAALLGKVQEKDPQMYIVPFMLGEGAARGGWEKAAAGFQKCLQLNPNFNQAMTGLSRVLVYLGKDDEAAQWARNALKVNPANSRAWYQLGIIESKTDKNAGIADYQKAVSIQGSFAPLRRDLGLLYFQKGKLCRGRGPVRQGSRVGVNDVPLYNFLGISYGHTSRLDKAVEAYKKAYKAGPEAGGGPFKCGVRVSTIASNRGSRGRIRDRLQSGSKVLPIRATSVARLFKKQFTVVRSRCWRFSAFAGPVLPGERKDRPGRPSGKPSASDAASSFRRCCR